MCAATTDMAPSDTATALKAFLAGRTTLDIEPNALLNELREVVSTNGLNVNLPQNARALTSALKRDLSAMRELWGLDLRTAKSRGRRLYRFRPWQPKNAVAANGQVRLRDSEQGEVRVTIILRPSKSCPCVIVAY